MTEYLNCKPGSHAVVSKEDHNPPDFFLILKRPSYQVCLLLTDPFNLSKPSGLMFNHVKGFCAKARNKPFGSHRPDPLDKAGPEIFLYASDCSRDYRLIAFDLELPAILRVTGPFTLHKEGLPDSHKRKSADHCDDLASPSGGAPPFTVDSRYSIETIFITVSNPLNCPLNRKHVHPP